MIEKYKANLTSLIQYIPVLIIVVYPISLFTQYKLFYVVALISLYLYIIFCLCRLPQIPPIVISFNKAKHIYILFILMIASYSWALYPSTTKWQASINLIFMWIFYISHILLIKNMKNWIVLASIILPYLFLGLFTIIYLNYGSVRATTIEMKEAVGSISNVGPAVVELCLPYLIYSNCILTVKKQKILVIGAIISTLMIIILSQSRAAYIIAILICVLSIIFCIKKTNLGVTISNYKNNNIIFGLILTVLVIAYIWKYDETIGYVIQRFIEIKDKNLLDPPTRGEIDYKRIVMYYEGINIIKKYPVMGIGFGGFSPYLKSEYDFPLISHNIFITLWGELGITGLILFLWIVIDASIRLFQATSKIMNRSNFYFYSATKIALIAALLHAQFRPQLSNPFLYIIIAVAFSLPSISSQH